MNKPKNVLITGSSSGFGYLLALQYARRGFTTYASVRNLKSEGAQNLKTIASEEKLSLHVIHIDITDEVSIKKATESITGSIDILINNAGFGYLGPVEDHSIEEIKDQYETNVFGMLRMIKQIAPRMRMQKNGLIINLSSINGLIPFPLWGVYCSSKFAVESLSEALRFELSHFGIKVVLIEPGSFLTKFTDNKKFPKKLSEGNSPYLDLHTRFFERFNKANDRIKKGLLTHFFNPARLTNKIFKVSLENNPKLRYRVGIDAHLYYAVRMLLPAFLWEKLMKMVYKW